MEPARSPPRLSPMSRHPMSTPSVAPPPDRATPHRLSVEPVAMQHFSDAHRSGGQLLGGQLLGGTAHADQAALIDLGITFGMIGAEFLAAVVEFLEIHRRCLDTAAAAQQQLAVRADDAATLYAATDRTAAERELTL
ncbi:ESX-1 secretion-associated protein [Gordonia jinghuaiqii]|uniref:ESX-1 secretion-associated protein n=2 Tax=Gordonia jinghuaiqii TaxID=2758710 RepID=A0A7D7LYQ5_9ACTN|nr:ESX-1 secretion-associated protein [Gordonia jinghuaiqii]QMT03159.1 ESX-1 secretion-associated protein [Gordonia jinghuaiqii]